MTEVVFEVYKVVFESRYNIWLEDLLKGPSVLGPIWKDDILVEWED